jgi:hypothetical protein
MDAVALASVITSGVIGAAGIGLAAWNAQQERATRREDREADAHAELVRRGAEVIGPLLTLLSAIEPDRIAVDGGSFSQKQIDDAQYRFGELRDPLAAFALSHPSPRVLDLAGQFDIAVGNAISQTGSLLRDVLGHRDVKKQLEAAREKHDDARQLARELHAAIIEGDKQKSPV